MSFFVFLLISLSAGACVDETCDIEHSHEVLRRLYTLGIFLLPKRKEIAQCANEYSGKSNCMGL